MAYDKEKLKEGYKGDFVVQNHFATNHHWDFRLEFPVVSLQDALSSYLDIRSKDTPEPKSKKVDKPGTVLRSWAIPKHKVPTSKPILAQETENHDIKYKDFSGIIPEGVYGAGRVEIYDKGIFEFVKVVYDKEYVFNLKGKKIKGYYALIKTKGKSFLWIKVKDKKKYEKKSNILRYGETIVLSIIKRCPEKSKDDRPDSEQQWCLFTSDGEKLLGRHPTKEKAKDQEIVIQIHKHK